MQHTVRTSSVEETTALGERLGRNLRGGEVIELVSDLGGGKTTLAKGITMGFGSAHEAASPSFVVSYVYERADGKRLHHFDFYRLPEAGVVGQELAEIVGDHNDCVVLEWAEVAKGMLPKERLILNFTVKDEKSRAILINYPASLNYLVDGVL